ncbi:hypothetical protein EAS64_35595 [Trebonia kvetii]|uniref:Uncharacterized protein n=1 Tax=Trebonia kvetii TaxID=2480626 RepID=A0A6P2BNQ0_9ACTN|nr:ATP-binding protein [Trebonia kvetii]TVZ00689.1 hypothetical protein EAS64_35595 [Trebonia kvetii]
MKPRTRDWPAGGEKPAGGPHWIAERKFRRGDAPEVRRFAQAFGWRASLRGGQLPDFVLAVNEAAASVTARRPGTARVRLWSAGTRVYCEVHGDAIIKRDIGGGRHGEVEALRRYVLRRVCDYFRVASGPDDTRVLLTMAVRRAARDPSGRAGMRRPR